VNFKHQIWRFHQLELKQHGPKKKQKNARETNKHTNKQEKQTAEKLHKLAAKKAEILEKVQV
jgi:2,3-bisphosphoglycerate-independent phosphoglycerate mutase